MSASTTNARYRVKFSQIGRKKTDWVSILRQRPTEPVLQRLVRKSGALMSRDIVCEFHDEAGTHGSVYAGIRPVGTFTVEHVVVDDPGPFSVDHIAAVL